MAADLLRLEGEQIRIVPSTTAGKNSAALSKDELDMLLDRSTDAMTTRQKGWNSADAGAGDKGVNQAAFAVFNAPVVDQASDAVSRLMGEEPIVD